MLLHIFILSFKIIVQREEEENAHFVLNPETTFPLSLVSSLEKQSTLEKTWMEKPFISVILPGKGLKQPQKSMPDRHLL